MTKISKKITELVQKDKKLRYNYKILTETGEVVEKFKTKWGARNMLPYYRKQYMWIELSIEKINEVKDDTK